jgi:integrase/recombinase XerD
MTELFEQFLQEREYLKNVTPATIKSYRCAWKAATRGLPELAEQLDAKVLEGCVLKMRQAGLSPVSVNTHLRSLNAFLRWLHGGGHTATSLVVPKLIAEQKILKTFTVEQIQRFQNHRPTSTSQHRVHTLACLLVDTGLRSNEALSLKRADVDLHNLLLRAMGKGRKERVVPISFELRKILFRWLQTHEHDYVFATRTGSAISYRNAVRDFGKLCRRLQIKDVRCSFHTLRHTFGLNYIKRGGDSFMLQRILGHSTLEMTRRYVNLQTADLSAVHHRLSILSRS